MHLSVLDLLDRIDSTCLGLTNHYFYAIHHRRHGTVPLSARRDGPNDLEWAWRFATRPLCESSLQPDAKSGEKPASGNEETLENAEGPRCFLCGVTRCELARHVRDWMPDGLEYCAVSDRYGPLASSGVSNYCHKRSPRHPQRCGRHHPKRSDTALAEDTPIQPRRVTTDIVVDNEKHSVVVDVQELLFVSEGSLSNQCQE
ncbi:F-box domain-containing protein [Colletotrichum plurivorum]|uniref:F-box domain-containing protein n=1 Tax=Colletotrichum plurivorum TaxID=2175906 RepID=A0A8H6N772_9PEZI|nr:F-box domain-containing protein [Colletotrichum plurivorum]